MASRKMTSVIFQHLPIFQRQTIYPSNHFLNQSHEIPVRFATAGHTREAQQMKKLLEDKFPLARSIDVLDISGGCGSMYEVHIDSVEFKGLTVVKQHRLVNEALKDQIKLMHGLRIQTSIPPGSTK